MKKLHLHIGMHKTGTSSLQSTLFQGREKLGVHGICYLDIEDNHSAAFFSLFAPAPEKYRVNIRRGINTAEKAEEHNRQLSEQLSDKLAAIHEPHTIISGEDLSLLPKSQIPALHDFLAPHFDDIMVVGYARPPVSFINSLAQQALKGGATLQSLMNKPPKPDYQWRFQKFLDVFGADNVVLRPFVPDALKGGCIIADFLSAAGLPSHIHGHLSIRHNNSSLSQKGGEVLDHINRMLPVLSHGRPNPERPAHVPETVARLKGPGFRLPRSVVAKALEDADWDINWMTRHLTRDMPEGVSFDDRDQLADLPDDNPAPFDADDPDVSAILADLFPNGLPEKPA